MSNVITKEKILNIIADQKNIFYKKDDVISRKYLLKDINNDFIEIISGIRRSGKSTLLNEIRSLQKDKDFYFNFDDERLIGFTSDDFSILYEVFLENFGDQENFYFDEIQNVFGWERFVRRLHDYGKKIFITGSNANLLSFQLGTHLTGRYKQSEVFPFCFREFLEFKKIKIPNNLNLLSTKEKIQFKKYFLEFQDKGGFPQFLKTENVDYLKSLYESILYRDIVVKNKIGKVNKIKELSNYLSSNIGKLVSFNKLKNYLGLSNANTVKEYFGFFEESYLYFLIKKYDFSLKKQNFGDKKIYCIDNKLASEIGFRFSEDNGRFLENLVFLELRRKNKDIFYFNKKGECDFIIYEKGRITKAFQVCYNLNLNNRKREINGLVEACKEFGLRDGFLLTLEQEEEFEEDGINIKIIPAWNYFLKN